MLKDEIEELKGSVETMEKEVKEKTLALEMLSELKKSSKRWFVISIILLVSLVISNIGWLIYESSFETVYEDSTQETYYTDNPKIKQHHFRAITGMVYATFGKWEASILQILHDCVRFTEVAPYLNYI